MRSRWHTETIGTVCEVVNGGTPKTGVPAYWGGPHQWITPAEMGKRSSPYVAETDRTLSDAGIKNSSARPLPPQSVILSSRAPIGHLAINTVPMATNQGCKGLIPSKVLDAKFLYYFLLHSVELLDDLGTGTTFKELSGGSLKNVLIPVPAIPEQKRVVSIMDEAFEGMDAATTNAEKCLADASELFGSYLNTVLTGKGEGRSKTNIGQQADILTGFAFKSQHYTDAPDAVPLLRGDNIVQGQFRWEDVKKWPLEKAEEFQRFNLMPNDIVLAMDRTWVKAGLKFAKVSISDIPCLLLQRVARLRAKETIDKDFLYHLIGSRLFTDYVLSIQTGLGVPHISGKQIEAFRFSLPGVDEQRDLVHRLNTLSLQCRRLDAIYLNKLTSLSKLKESLLAKAFSGELTAKPDQVLNEAVA